MKVCAGYSEMGVPLDSVSGWEWRSGLVGEGWKEGSLKYVSQALCMIIGYMICKKPIIYILTDEDPGLREVR